MKALALGQEMTDVIEDVKLTMTEPGFGLAPETCDALVLATTDSLLTGAALPLVVLNAYRWFCRELGRLLRTKCGEVLALNLELLLRKWLTFGLEPNTLQLLVSVVYNKLKAEAHVA